MDLHLVLHLVVNSSPTSTSSRSTTTRSSVGSWPTRSRTTRTPTASLVDPIAYPDAYAHLDALRDDILASGEVAYADEFDWETHFIQDDEVLNAFAAPGGYIYVYTGLMRYLEEEDQLAGVLGHEIAHAANRHSTEQLTKQYGIEPC